VRIAGRLSETTLGDVLGALFRARVTGLMRLTETSGPTAGRTHGIYLRQGLVIAVDTPASPPSLSERCARSSATTAELLSALFELADAALSFHVVCGPPQGPILPISPQQYLVGRPRARDRARGCGHDRNGDRDRNDDREFQRAGDTTRVRATLSSLARQEALSMLGLEGDASAAEVTRAFRRRARELHPDLCAGAERRSAEQRFAALSAAYHTLIG
jgi:hypothetical protein